MTLKIYLYNADLTTCGRKPAYEIETDTDKAILDLYAALQTEGEFVNIFNSVIIRKKYFHHVDLEENS